MKKGIWVAMAWAAAMGQLAQAGLTGKISGRVMDLQSGEGLFGARVEVVSTGLGALADHDGYYHIINVPPGSYTLRARMTGYAAVAMIDIRVNPGLTTKADFRLKISPIQGQEVTVTAERPLVVKDLTATQRVIRIEEMARMPYDNPQQALASQSGVVAKGEQFHVRGGRSDEVSYLIDGISIRDDMEGTSGLLVNTNALSDLSLMTGVFDAEYGQVMSGVISAQVKDGSTPGLHASSNGGSMFPRSQGRGYRNFQADWGRPLWAQRVKAFVAGDLTLSDDWDPHGEVVPHQDRQDYSVLAKLTGQLPWGQRLTLLGIGSRSQFGRYGHDWYFTPANFRSDLRRGKLLAASLNQNVSPSSFCTVTAGWFWDRNTFGVRDTFWDIGRHWWEDIRFLDYWDNQIYRNEQDSLVFTADYNHYGYDCPTFYRFGNYWK
ncbi:MAG TPA: TonB-dependent receptor, partial [Candidatus Edwardsbacteria bacterium]|nr:TonB-dependent receptor [Candidatus Edwardsbacteria bacterium]